MSNLRILIIILFTVVLSLPPASAQDNFDVNRMNRDLNIMENILQEIFKARHSRSGNTFILNSGSLLRSNAIRGTYLPDYGVIFLISDLRTSVFAFGTGPEGEESSFAFVYKGDSDNDTEVTEETVIERIREFLRDYASTIGQLNPDDKVMVLYGASPDRLHHESWVIAGDGDSDNDDLKTISVVASKEVLDDYRNGSISAEEFDKRISVSRVSKEDSGHLDMEVMANIFETAFKNRKQKSYRVHGSVDHLLIDNFGALFFFDASYSGMRDMLFLRATGSPGFDFSARRRARAESSNSQRSTQENKYSDLEKNEELTQAYSAFINQLKEYLVDYGRTLSSVKSDQMILLSVTLNTRNDELPERIDVQIKKSILEAIDKGNMNRDAALKQVKVREY